MRQARALAIILTTALWTAGTAVMAQPARPERECSAADIERALAGDYAGPPCRFTQMPENASAPVPARQTGSRPVELLGAPVSSSVEPGFRHAPAVSAPPAVSVRHVERQDEHTVVLDEAFFASGLTGGVERPYRPVYVYRGLILIAADGEVRTGFAGWDRRVGTTRVMDRLPARPPRAYPYD